MEGAHIDAMRKQRRRKREREREFLSAHIERRGSAHTGGERCVCVCVWVCGCVAPVEGGREGGEGGELCVIMRALLFEEAVRGAQSFPPNQ